MTGTWSLHGCTLPLSPSSSRALARGRLASRTGSAHTPPRRHWSPGLKQCNGDRQETSWDPQVQSVRPVRWCSGLVQPVASTVGPSKTFQVADGGNTFDSKDRGGSKLTKSLKLHSTWSWETRLQKYSTYDRLYLDLQSALIVAGDILQCQDAVIKKNTPC